MKALLNLEIKLYNIKDRDWLNYKITKDNPLTIHHIIKKEDGGKNTIDNTVPLTKRSHNYLHIIEVWNKYIYDDINIVLKDILKKGLRKKHQKKIEKLMLLFEDNHSRNVIKGNKGKNKVKSLTLKRKRDQEGVYRKR